jgi:hypothetical protein
MGFIATLCTRVLFSRFRCDFLPNNQSKKLNWKEHIVNIYKLKIYWPLRWSCGQSSCLQIQSSGFSSRRYQIFWEVVGLEPGTISFVSTVEQLLRIIGKILLNCTASCRIYKLLYTVPQKPVTLKYSNILTRIRGTQERCWLRRYATNRNVVGSNSDNAKVYFKFAKFLPATGLGNQEYGRRDTSHWPRDTLYSQMLTLTSPTRGDHSVGIVRWRTYAMELFLFPAAVWRWHWLNI